MNEDATFKKLKGLTELEIAEIHHRLHIELCTELGTVDVPLWMMKDRLDVILAPYGHSSKDFYNFSIDDLS